MDRGKNAELGHHENAVHRQHGDPLRLIGVQQHQRCLLAARCVAQDPAAPDQQVEALHLYHRLPRRLL